MLISLCLCVSSCQILCVINTLETYRTIDEQVHGKQQSLFSPCYLHWRPLPWTIELFLWNGRVFGTRVVDLKDYFCPPVCNKSPVFHSSSSEIRNGNHVLLWKRKLHIEVSLEKFQNSWSYLLGVLSLIQSVWCWPDSKSKWKKTLHNIP